MKKNHIIFILPVALFAQETTTTLSSKQQYYDTNKFSQMYDLLATPNMFRTASGAATIISNNRL
jgi:hypothetical protein